MRVVTLRHSVENGVLVTPTRVNHLPGDIPYARIKRVRVKEMELGTDSPRDTVVLLRWLFPMAALDASSFAWSLENKNKLRLAIEELK